MLWIGSITLKGQLAEDIDTAGSSNRPKVRFSSFSTPKPQKSPRLLPSVRSRFHDSEGHRFRGAEEGIKDSREVEVIIGGDQNE